MELYSGCMGRGGGAGRCGTFGALQLRLRNGGLGSGVDGLAEQGLMGSRQELGLYPAAVGRLSAEKGGGLRKNPCGWVLENDEDLHGLPGTQ